MKAHAGIHDSSELYEMLGADTGRSTSWPTLSLCRYLIGNDDVLSRKEEERERERCIVEAEAGVLYTVAAGLG